ncbi:MAG: hypothetical protein NXI20_21960 [bacterium]|jgi:hypothetical protein|nr:hypothetical protein [bacterium]
MIKLANKFGNLYYTGFYDKTNGWVNTSWFGFIRTEEAIEGVQNTLKLIQESGCSKLLSDNSAVKGSWNETADWLEKNWFEPATKYGLRRHATMLSNDQFWKLSQDTFEKAQGSDTIAMKNFQDIEEAKKWLKEG